MSTIDWYIAPLCHKNAPLNMHKIFCMLHYGPEIFFVSVSTLVSLFTAVWLQKKVFVKKISCLVHPTFIWGMPPIPLYPKAILRTGNLLPFGMDLIWWHNLRESRWNTGGCIGPETLVSNGGVICLYLVRPPSLLQVQTLYLA